MNELFTSTEKSKLIQQGSTFVRDFFQKSADKLDRSINKTEEINNPEEESSNGMDWGKIIESLEAKEKSIESEDGVDSNQMKEDAMNIISQVLDRTKQILDENENGNDNDNNNGDKSDKQE